MDFVGLNDALLKFIEGVIDQMDLINNWLDKLEFSEVQGGDVFKFSKTNGQYTHDVTLEDNKIIYENNNGERYEYPCNNDLEIQKAFKEIEQHILELG